ncbi:uncharacterized protein LOC111996891 [Quercus suber]|uniref:uncharacterized protein LOC111996891 n=1 Tax=Quercus suber TaxID=58331 RepID=UPI000CE26EE4|nr:uncharacterized protein LOC111996891 [Quercus suber]
MGDGFGSDGSNTGDDVGELTEESRRVFSPGIRHCKQPKQVAEEARNYTEECRQFDTTTPIRIPARAKTPWKLPKAGWYKVNVDGAIFSDLGSCGVGVVIRNEKGQLIGALSKRIQLPLGPLEVEAKAMEEGIQLARDLSLKEIIIEGDAKQVVTAISDTGRNGNMVVHQLAKHAKFEDECTVWVEDTPPIVSKQVLMDVISTDSCPNQ